MPDFEEYREEERHKDRRKSKDLDYAGIERRRAERSKGIIVEYKKHGLGDAPKSVFLRDMSSKGLSISVTEKFDVGDVLDLNVYLTGIIHPAVIEVEVRWVKISEYFQKANRVHYDVGLKVCKAEERDLRLIDEYIERYK